MRKVDFSSFTPSLGCRQTLTISPLNKIHKDQLEQLQKRSVSACRLNICSKVDETTDEIGPFDIDTNAESDLESVRNG